VLRTFQKEQKFAVLKNAAYSYASESSDSNVLNDLNQQSLDSNAGISIIGARKSQRNNKVLPSVINTLFYSLVKLSQLNVDLLYNFRTSRKLRF
jgi:hypothetical protein